MKKMIHGTLLAFSVAYMIFFMTVSVLTMFGECGAPDTLKFLVILLICLSYMAAFIVANK